MWTAGRKRGTGNDVSVTIFHLLHEHKMKVNLIAVDEAHCISQWGNDFRPAYNSISILRSIHPHVNCIALTATAKQEVINDVIDKLALLQPKIIKELIEEL